VVVAVAQLEQQVLLSLTAAAVVVALDLIVVAT
jgi:hypothetical protein